MQANSEISVLHLTNDRLNCSGLLFDSPGHILLDGKEASPPEKKRQSPQFSTPFCCGQTSGCIKMLFDMDAGLGPGHIVLDGDPAPSPPKKQGGTAPNFRLMYIVAK